MYRYKGKILLRAQLQALYSHAYYVHMQFRTLFDILCDDIFSTGVIIYFTEINTSPVFVHQR